MTLMLLNTRNLLHLNTTHELMSNSCAQKDKTWGKKASEKKHMIQLVRSLFNIFRILRQINNGPRMMRFMNNYCIQKTSPQLGQQYFAENAPLVIVPE